MLRRDPVGEEDRRFNHATQRPGGLGRADGPRVEKQWTRDIPVFISKADKNWPEVTGKTKVFE